MPCPVARVRILNGRAPLVRMRLDMELLPIRSHHSVGVISADIGSSGSLSEPKGKLHCLPTPVAGAPEPGNRISAAQAGSRRDGKPDAVCRETVFPLERGFPNT